MSAAASFTLVGLRIRHKNLPVGTYPGMAGYARSSCGMRYRSDLCRAGRVISFLGVPPQAAVGRCRPDMTVRARYWSPPSHRGVGADTASVKPASRTAGRRTASAELPLAARRPLWGGLRPPERGGATLAARAGPG